MKKINKKFNDLPGRGGSDPHRIYDCCVISLKAQKCIIEQRNSTTSTKAFLTHAILPCEALRLCRGSAIFYYIFTHSNSSVQHFEGPDTNSGQAVISGWLLEVKEQVKLQNILNPNGNKNAGLFTFPSASSFPSLLAMCNFCTIASLLYYAPHEKYKTKSNSDRKPLI